MTDITKCENKDCPVKEKCWRYLAPPSDLQTYAHFVYDKGCDYFWPIREKNETKS